MTTGKSSFSYVDLFSGCGGLSLGLEKTGGNLVLAVEKSPMAAETFFHNFVERIESPDIWEKHLEATINDQVRRGLAVAELGSVLHEQESMDYLAGLDIDVVAGGPPCQGFSLAGRRNPDDIRNQLPWQFLEFVAKVNPKIVIIENVVGMKHRFSGSQKQSVFEQLQIALSATGGEGYLVQGLEANALHYGAPQNRPRLLIVGLRADVARKLDINPGPQPWKSDFSQNVGFVPRLCPRPPSHIHGPVSVSDGLGHLAGGAEKRVSPQMEKYQKEMSGDWGLRSHSGDLKNHTKRSHQEKVIERFRLYQILSENQLPERLLNQINAMEHSNALTYVRSVGRELSYPLVSPDGLLEITSPNELADYAYRLRTGKHSQRVLRLNEPSRTVLTIGDDYVHPIEPRTFTVRELARFQGFPDSFEFRAKETTGGINRKTEVPQYSQVGNAVSPWLGRAIGQMILDLLRESDGQN